MHASSYENMQYCYDTYVCGSFLDSRPNLTVVDLGSADVNGSYRSIFNQATVQFIGLDLAPGPGVDILQEDPYRVPLPDATADIVVSGQMLEHCEYFWLSFQEMIRILKPDGMLFLIAPSAGEIHRYPVDCYRFYPDAYHALARYANCEVVAVWRDHREPWRDLVGVFARRQDNSDQARESESSTAVAVGVPAPGPAASTFEFSAPKDVEVSAGACDYLDLLREIHAWLKPRTYLEIGVSHGNSLMLATHDAIGVDPAPNMSMRLPVRARLFRESSDRFFREHGSALQAGIDLAFIDGMHLFEYALRDFMNIERHSNSGSVVVIDDILPNHPLQAARERQSATWTGDVWKIVTCLRKYRPDLILLPLGTGPTGLLLVVGLDASNSILQESYDQIVAEFAADGLSVPQSVLNRDGVLNPWDSRIAFLLRELHRFRRSGDLQAVTPWLTEWREALFELTTSGDTPAHTAMKRAYRQFRRSLGWMGSRCRQGFRSWVSPYGTFRWRLRRRAWRFQLLWRQEGLIQASVIAGRKLLNRARLS